MLSEFKIEKRRSMEYNEVPLSSFEDEPHGDSLGSEV